jgi:hypothetical protein
MTLDAVFKRIKQHFLVNRTLVQFVVFCDARKVDGKLMTELSRNQARLCPFTHADSLPFDILGLQITPFADCSRARRRSIQERACARAPPNTLVSDA